MDSREQIEVNLDKAILEAINRINKLPAGSKEQFLAVKACAELYKARDQQYKAESEYNSTIEVKDKEIQVKEKELEHEKQENKKNRTVQMVSGAGSLGFWAWQFAKVLRFEETGTATSIVFKTLMKVVRMF